jgi:hypothetical protein
MPENASYIRMRHEVLTFDEESRHCALCKGIDGGCCKRDLTILPEDEENIVEAAARGDIAPETIERARRRAADPGEEFCPFFGDQGECTIYPHRPLVCMQHGNGGLPKDRAVARKALTAPGSRTIRICELEQFSCDACAAQLDPMTRIPLSVVGKSVAILLTIQDRQRHCNPRTMNQFVSEQFRES